MERMSGLIQTGWNDDGLLLVMCFSIHLLASSICDDAWRGKHVLVDHLLLIPNQAQTFVSEIQLLCFYSSYTLKKIVTIQFLSRLSYVKNYNLLKKKIILKIHPKMFLLKMPQMSRLIGSIMMKAKFYLNTVNLSLQSKNWTFVIRMQWFVSIQQCWPTNNNLVLHDIVFSP